VRRALVPALLLLLVGSARMLTDEEVVAPVVAANGCWGGVIRYVADERKFTVDDTVCSDARFYRLEFSHDLRLIGKTQRAD
jgi:hypothetical protein